EFELFKEGCRFTDDTVMTCAVCYAVREYKARPNVNVIGLFQKRMVELGQKYPDAGYGGKFRQWLENPYRRPYNSFGNGSAMRVSACGMLADSLEEAHKLAVYSAEVTHNHPEGIKGAVAVAEGIFLARQKKSKEEIREHLSQYYDLDFTLDDIRPGYSFDVTCQGSVPQAIVCFLEAESFEDAVRNAVSLGGDSDTQAAIAGSLAEPYFGIPARLKARAYNYLTPELRSALGI
ncbi:MAG: ADP-ribosylglycohydrolase family protein, partial [Firmicutes bacterium]|nr:ADP-ribosylglycohydrolase family protein [Bacillota bacterium]